MLITRKSMFSGVVRSIDLPVTEAQMQAWEDGELIQKAMPNLTPGEREFIMTGVTDEEWNAEFGDIDEVPPYDWDEATKEFA